MKSVFVLLRRRAGVGDFALGRITRSTGRDSSLASFIVERHEPVHLAQLHGAVVRLPAAVGLLGNALRATLVGDSPTTPTFAPDLQNPLVAPRW